MIDPGLLALLGTVVSVAGGQILQMMRESRHRKWDREDRAQKAADLAEASAADAARIARELAATVAQSATSVAATVARTAAQSDAVAKSRAGQVLQKIAENTEISAKAFHEANQANLKFIQIHERMDAKDERMDAKET